MNKLTLIIQSKITFLFSVLLLLYLTSQSLSPWNGGMFSFQDPTQVGRVESFAQNLRSRHIPPRLAPEFSFRLGFPVFNYYAPTAYWITSVIVLLGLTATTAVKLSFLLTIILAFFGMNFFLQELFRGAKTKWPALLGASVYVTSTYFATEVIVRGNLAECWFLALFPFALGMLILNSRSLKKSITILTTSVLALLFTTHNMMLLFAVPTCFIFLLLYPGKKRNLFAFCCALLLDAYFLIPAFLENSLVQASTIAKEFNYIDHFLCPWQIWTAKGWVFGGSLPGCDNPLEMSFKLGKMQILLGAGGLATFFFQVLHQKKTHKSQLPLLFFSMIFFVSLFLTLSISISVWKLFSPVMSLFQFPWRFLAFGMFGVAVFAGYFFQAVRFPAQRIVIPVIMLLLFFPARKYFIVHLIPTSTYEQQYASDQYLTEHIAYKIPEYLTKDANLSYWRSLEPTTEHPSNFPFDPTQPVESSSFYQIVKNTPYFKAVNFVESGKATINIHYFPFWKIVVNGEPIIPDSFDQLARPQLNVQAADRILIYYQQTHIEKFANALTILGIFFVLFGSWLWEKVTHQPKKLLMKLGIFLCSGFFMVLRKPDSLLRPQLFAEDGIHWFAEQYLSGTIPIAITPVSGYFQTLSRLSAVVALFFPLLYVPLIFNLTAFFAQLLPIAYLLSKRLNQYAIGIRLFIILTYLLLTNTADTYLNLTNAQWYLALSIVLVLIARRAHSLVWKFLDFFVLFIGGLSGPFSVFLLIPTFYLVFKKKLVVHSFKVQLISLTAVIQALSLYFTASSAGQRLTTHVAPRLYDIYAIYQRQILWGLLAGPFNYDWIIKTLPFGQFIFLASTVGSIVLILYAALKARTELKMFMIFTLILFLSMISTPSIEADASRSAYQVMAEANGLRYWLIPMICLLVIFIWGVEQKKKSISLLFKLFLITLILFELKLCVHPRQLRYNAYIDYHWPEQIADFNELPKGSSKKFLINPLGWSMILEKK